MYKTQFKKFHTCGTNDENLLFLLDTYAQISHNKTFCLLNFFLFVQIKTENEFLDLKLKVRGQGLFNIFTNAK